MFKFNYTNIFLTTLGIISISTTGVLAASVVPIDLSNWSKKSFTNRGIWKVQDGGNTVSQRSNGAPTFFVSPNDFLNTTIKGKFKVQTSSDNDFIGFVFGYQNLQENTSDFDFLLFDWKQSSQTAGGHKAEEGFTLSLVEDAPINNSGKTATSFDLTWAKTPFWNHTDPSMTILGTDYGSTRGWADNTEYDFTLLYQANRLKIDIKGGTGDFASGQTIFDFTPNNLGLTSFDSGQFGFYNYSQSNVLYQVFTEEYTAVSTPEPTTIIGAILTLKLGALSRRK